jgi:hypothetical protein
VICQPVRSDRKTEVNPEFIIAPRRLLTGKSNRWHHMRPKSPRA